MEIKKYGFRNWALYDDNGELVCVTVYKRGALEVARRLDEDKILICESSKRIERSSVKYEGKEEFQYVYQRAKA